MWNSCIQSVTVVTSYSRKRQIARIGVLMEFESLISCYGDEMGMLEDMDVAMQDVANVQYQLEKRSTGVEDVVTLSGRRYSYTVTLRLDEDVFNALPDELSRGQFIKIVPIVFSIGINEQATLAEKIGDTSLQDNVNQENYKKLYAYYEDFTTFSRKMDKDYKQNSAEKLEDLMRHLGVCVKAKKNKNVDVLSLAAEVCVTMRGVRFTGCKSAKDRTAMAVTLEQVRFLQREFGLAQDYFLHALECFRSEGVRRDNTYKNTGVSKYAFNSIQLLYLPKLYRPPAGTYGNIET